MCLSTVYIKSGNQQVAVMQDVALMEYQNEGYLLTGLLGNQKFVKGKIRKIDFADDHIVVLEKEKNKKEETGGDNGRRKRNSRDQG